MSLNVVFVIRCLYSAMSLTLFKEQRFIGIIYDYYYPSVLVKGTKQFQYKVVFVGYVNPG